MLVSERVLRTGVRLFGVDEAAIQPLGGMDGAVYACQRNGQQFVIKFTPTATNHLEAFRARMDFVNYLACHGVSVSRPVASVQGRLIEACELEETCYAVSMAVRASVRHVGRHVDRDNVSAWNSGLFYRWGRVLGQMHSLTKRYESWLRAKNPPALVAGHTPHDLLQDWRAEHEHMAGWCQDDTVRSKWLELGETFMDLPQARDSFGLVHNDLHQHNFVVSDAALTVIDFDLCTYHWFITDIAIALFHALWEGPTDRAQSTEAFGRSFLGSLMAGYELENRLDDAWFRLLPRFLKYRQILLYIAFSNTWGEQRNEWQDWQLKDWRRRIIHDIPVLDIDF